MFFNHHSLPSLLLSSLILTFLFNTIHTQSSSKPTCSTSHGKGFVKHQKLIGYYPAYNLQFQSPKAINYTLYTDVIFFVTVPNENYTISYEEIKDANATSVALDFVREAKAHHVNPLISYGGWDGSRSFSNLTSNRARRQKTAALMVKFAKDLGFTGIDLDWEHPNADGIGCNSRSPADTRRLGLLVKEIRKLWPEAQLTAAIAISGLIGADGNPATRNETKILTKYLDYANIMAYDVNGNWQTYSGPLAPIRSRCSAPDSPGSIEDAFQIFTDQGFSPSQLLLGIPAYGIGYHLKSSKLEVKDFNGTLTSYYQNISAPVTAAGKTDDPPKLDVCGNMTSWTGTWLVKELIEHQWLSIDQKTSSNGFTRHQDECSGMPFITNGTLLISYDDVYSTVEKTKFAKSKGMAGIFFFDTQGAPDETIYAAKQAL